MFEENPMSSGRGGSMQAKSRGFSLVELLVAVTIFGVMSTVILNLYVNVVRSTTSSEEVVEVQQGLRIALDQVARDIQMAGFLIPTAAPITDAGTNQITMVTATAFNSFARVATNGTFPAASNLERAITVSNPAMAQLFIADNYVRIINPATGCQPAALPDCGDNTTPFFKVSGVNTSALKLVPWELSGGTISSYSPANSINIVPGDMIVQVPSPADDATYPNVLTYQLEDDPASTDPNMMVLSRIWRTGLPALTIDNRNTNQRVIATNISGLSFEYLMDDGTVETAVVANRRDKIVGVRILLTGLTEDAKTRGSKIRELQTTVKIRNI
jgi:prepilin-type N-terminal cleavage/methylation domain-containing protein